MIPRIREVLNPARVKRDRTVTELTNERLARTMRSLARTFDEFDPWRAAVMDEAADRLDP